jgi:hypothetical protein
MRKVVLLIASLAAVVLLAVLVHVADGDDGVTYRGSYEQLKERPGMDHPGRDHPGKGHGHRHHPKKPRHQGHGASPAVDLSCRLHDGVLVLRYSYGASERVAPYVDARGSGLVVGVDVTGPPEGTVVPSIALLGQARFAVLGDPAWIRTADGADLPCPAGKR